MNSVAGLFLFLFGAAFLLMPVVALVVALVASSKANKSERSLREREREAETLRTRLVKAEQRLAALEAGAHAEMPAQAHKTPAGAPAVPDAPPVPAPSTSFQARESSHPPVATPPVAPPSVPVHSGSAPPSPVPGVVSSLSGDMATVPFSGGMLRVPAEVLHADQAPPAPSLPAASARPPAKAVVIPPPAAAVPPPLPPPLPPKPAPPVVPSEAAPLPPVRPPVRPPAPPVAPGPPKEGGWERRLGIALPVWIGAVALVVSGVFLVKYSVEHGMLGPAARVTLATLFGAALLVAGEWLRKRSSMTAQGASAAGVAILYAAFLAGTVLYRPLIEPWVGFGLMALVTVAAVALSLRQGMIVAVLGLIGGFSTPYWIGVVSASPARLFAYLLLLQSALILVTRKRQWNGLAVLTLVMGLGAAFQRVLAGTAAADAPWIGTFLLVSAGAFVSAAKSWKPPTIGAKVREAGPVSTFLGCGALLGAFLALSVLAVRTHFGLPQWGFLGLLALACLVLGRLAKEYAHLPWVGFAIVTILQAGWVVQSSPDQRPDLWLVAAGMALVFGLGGWLAHHGAPAPAPWATLSAAGGLAGFGLAWWADKLHGITLEHWGYLSLGMAVPYVVAATFAAMPERRRLLGEGTLAAFCVAATAFVSFAVPLELSVHWLSVAWALEVAALAWLLSKLKVDALGTLGLLVAVGVVIRLLLNPEVLRYPLGPLPVFNWILYGYGIPALAFGLAAYWYGRAHWKGVSAALVWGAAGLLFALLTLEVRQGFHPEGLVGAFPKVVEWATYSNLWLLSGLLALVAYLKWRHLPVGLAGCAFLALATAKIALFDCLLANPLWTPDAVGSWPVLNWLVYVYALPALAFAGAAWLLGQSSWRPAAAAATAVSVVLAMVFTALEVRQGFHTAGLPGSAPTLAEWGTYTLMYLAAGLVLLLIHTRWGKEAFKNAGMAFVLVAVAKVGFVDLWSANPLWTHSSVGEWPILNWILYAYGLPALALLAAKPLLSEDGEGHESFISFAQTAALVLAVACASLEVRQAFHPGFLNSGDFTLMEVATYGHVWLLIASGLVLGWARWGNPVAMWGGRVLYGVVLVKLVLLDAVVCNPLLWHRDVGGLPIVNGLLYVYGVPILLLALASRLPAGEAWVRFTRPVSLWGGLALGLLLLTLEVRQYFHPHFLDDAPLDDMENYAYSAVWILFSLVLLTVGILKRGKGSRVASLIVIFFAVTKVFVYDLRHLQDLYRVGSFLALGLSLLLISYLFQRFVFSGDRDE